MCADKFIALDIGGANIKIAALERNRGGGLRFSSASHVFPMWQRADDLAGFLNKECASHPTHHLAVTLTAELADVFATKREGVLHVLNAVRAAFTGCCIQVLTTNAELIPLDRALADPLQAAGANWAASAWAAAHIWPEGILGDTGSTTTDLIPFENGCIRPIGRTDPERLLSGELVYTGILRTPCSHLSSRVPWRGGLCRVSPEYFTIAGDVHLLLGNIHPDDYQWPTPDGRGITVDELKARIARLICGDTEMLTDDEIVAIARYLYNKQIDQVADGMRQVLARMKHPLPLLCVGSGRFLLKAAAAQVNTNALDGAELCGQEEATIFPAWSLCMMLAAQQEGAYVFERFKAAH